MKSALVSLTLLFVGASCVAGNGRRTVIDPDSVLVVRGPPSGDCEHKKAIRPGSTDNIQTLRHKAARAGANVLVVYEVTRIDHFEGYVRSAMSHAYLCPSLRQPHA